MNFFAGSCTEQDPWKQVWGIGSGGKGEWCKFAPSRSTGFVILPGRVTGRSDPVHPGAQASAGEGRTLASLDLNSAAQAAVCQTWGSAAQLLRHPGNNSAPCRGRVVLCVGLTAFAPRSLPLQAGQRKQQVDSVTLVHPALRRFQNLLTVRCWEFTLWLDWLQLLSLPETELQQPRRCLTHQVLFAPLN